jgi:hypothetical protein
MWFAKKDRIAYLSSAETRFLTSVERDVSRASHPHNMSLTRDVLTAFFRVG